MLIYSGGHACVSLIYIVWWVLWPVGLSNRWLDVKALRGQRRAARRLDQGLERGVQCEHRPRGSAARCHSLWSRQEDDSWRRFRAADTHTGVCVCCSVRRIGLVQVESQSLGPQVEPFRYAGWIDPGFLLLLLSVHPQLRLYWRDCRLLPSWRFLVGIWIFIFFLKVYFGLRRTPAGFLAALMVGEVSAHLKAASPPWESV